jgi:hypothetical protein
VTEDFVFAEQANVARCSAELGGIDENHCVCARKVNWEVKRWRTEIREFYIVWEVVLGFQHLDGEGSDTVVAQQHVSDSRDQ